MKVKVTKEMVVPKIPYFILAILIFVADVVSKYLVMKHLPFPEESGEPLSNFMTVIEPFLRFYHLKNTGVAFGMGNNFSPDIQPAVNLGILVIQLFAVGLIIYFILTSDKKYRLSLIGFGSILGGALGNITDRIVFKTVTDFIDMGLTDTFRFPYKYNVADAGITIGVALILIAFLILKEDVGSYKEKGAGESAKGEAESDHREE